MGLQLITECRVGRHHQSNISASGCGVITLLISHTTRNTTSSPGELLQAHPPRPHQHKTFGDFAIVAYRSSLLLLDTGAQQQSHVSHRETM